MSKTDKFIDTSDGDRDWLLVSTGYGFKNVKDDVNDDIAMLQDFLEGEPIAIKEVRAAAVRALSRGWFDAMGYGNALVALLFDRNACPEFDISPVWTVDFKRTDAGQSSPRRDISMAAAIQAVRDCGKSYNEAIEWAAEQFGIGTRRVQQIYGEHKSKFNDRRVNVRQVKKKLNLKD